jgi:hypothetical protein
VLVVMTSYSILADRGQAGPFRGGTTKEFSNHCAPVMPAFHVKSSALLSSLLCSHVTECVGIFPADPSLCGRVAGNYEQALAVFSPCGLFLVSRSKPC